MEKEITIKIEKSGFDNKNFVRDEDNVDLTEQIFEEITECFESVIRKFIRLDSFTFTDAVKKEMEKKKNLLPTNFESFKGMGFGMEIK